MKFLFTFLLFVLIQNICFSQKHDVRKVIDIKNVDSMEVNMCFISVKGDSSIKKVINSQKFIYNDGLLSNLTTTTSRGDKLLFSYSYNEKDLLFLIEGNPAYKENYKLHYFYNVDDQLVTKEKEDNLGKRKVEEYFYDLKKNKIEFKKYKLDNELYDSFRYFYKDNMNIRTVELSSFGDVIRTTEFKYDEFQRVVEQIVIIEDSVDELEDESKRIPSYDFFKTIHSYDERGNLESEITFENGTRIHEIRYAYDEFGELIQMKKIENGKTSYDFKWKLSYDEIGNWIELIKFKNGNPHSVTNRTINYKTS